MFRLGDMLDTIKSIPDTPWEIMVIPTQYDVFNNRYFRVHVQHVIPPEAAFIKKRCPASVKAYNRAATLARDLCFDMKVIVLGTLFVIGSSHANQELVRQILEDGPHSINQRFILRGDDNSLTQASAERGRAIRQLLYHIMVIFATP